MTIYEDIGLDKVINCSGKMTALGVSKISDEVAQAMGMAGKDFVVIDELIDRAGEIISSFTGSEDSCITASASAGIAISVGALIARDSRVAIERLPNSEGLKNEIIIQKGHMINFGGPISTMIRLGGGKIVEVGFSNKVLTQHVEESINENTAALFYVKSHHCVQKGMVSLEDMIKISKKYGIPLIVDAAAEENLQRYVKLGADLVIYSGAKAFEGPTSGFITGKKELIKHCKLQYLGIGRAMKIGKENIMGLLRALEIYSQGNIDTEINRQKNIVSKIIEELKSIVGMSIQMIQDEAGRKIFRAQIEVEEEIIGFNCLELVKRLKEGNPKIYVRDHFANVGKLSLDVRSVDETDVEDIVLKLREVTKGNI
ncbi:DgaE family pyridoxal phosphate-dependent ammonia lyase [Wukongibacter sp. M2B1]|uniref:DgaE family pyridoxal phosphate-dependent ammonia lyase n=1 Tax=Wukongibacter sp. M2B1 TaxID=3088895 RepID=UPI003D7BF5DC